MSKKLKIVYYFGAGASYNAVPILNKLGDAMIAVADVVKEIITSNYHALEHNEKLFNNVRLIEYVRKLKFYGEKALEFGSIDIYARRLFLLDNNAELDDLKLCISIFFDLWENYYHKIHFSFNPAGYDRIDKRYISLLSVLMEKTALNPKLNDSVTFLSWNYDLQLEMAYESFMRSSKNSLLKINEDFSFIGNNENPNFDVIHLNGYRGIIKMLDKFHQVLKRQNIKNEEDCLSELVDFLDNYHSELSLGNTQIKYAWEDNSKAISNAIDIMLNADVLVVIGYSFPSFNREIDTKLVRAFQRGNRKRKIVYQDPNANPDIVKSIFKNSDNVLIIKDNLQQFYIPHEYLFPGDIKGSSTVMNPSVH